MSCWRTDIDHYPAYAAISKNLLDFNKIEECSRSSVAIMLADILAGADDSAEFPHIFSSRRTLPLS
jgi:hypothetical protein